MPHSHADDYIPDPNEFLYNGDEHGNMHPKLLISFMGNMSRSMGGITEALQANTRQMDTMQKGFQKLIDAELKRTLEHQETMQNIKRIDGRIDDRKGENANNEKSINKAWESIDNCEKEIITHGEKVLEKANKYSEGKVKDLKNLAAAVWTVSAFLLYIILDLEKVANVDLKDRLTTLERKIGKVKP